MKQKENNMDETLYYTATEISERFPIPVGTLANMRSRGKGPKYYKADGKVLYKMADMVEWIESTPEDGDDQ